MLTHFPDVLEDHNMAFTPPAVGLVVGILEKVRSEFVRDLAPSETAS